MEGAYPGDITKLLHNDFDEILLMKISFEGMNMFILENVLYSF